MKRTTIRKLGPQLPIGMPTEDGKLSKGFEIRPYKSRIDRHLGLWREANANKSLAYLVTEYVAMILKSIGNRAFALDKDGTPTDETRFDISQLFFADVMYIYVWSRITELDPYIVKPVKCPVCQTVTPSARFDLQDADVLVVESIDEMEKWVDLRKGFALRGKGGTAKRLKLHPVKWLVMHHDGVAGGSVSGASFVQLQHSITGVNGSDEPYMVMESELDDLHKVDALLLEKETDRVSAGLNMQTSINCPGDPDEEKECGFEIVEPLDWTFDTFFGSSFDLNPPTAKEDQGEAQATS